MLKQLEDSHLDAGLLKASQLPTWMELDTLYIFKFDGKGDSSEYIHKIHIK